MSTALQDIHGWPGLKAMGAVRRTRRSQRAPTPAPLTTEIAYYLLSEPMTPERLNQYARDHWGVENRLHWVLDVDMNEDRARNRCDNGPQNLAILKHMAINKLNAEPSKLSIRRKLKKPTAPTLSSEAFSQCEMRLPCRSRRPLDLARAGRTVILSRALVLSF